MNEPTYKCSICEERYIDEDMMFDIPLGSEYAECCIYCAEELLDDDDTDDS